MQDVIVDKKTPFIQQLNKLHKGVEFVSEDGRYAIVRTKYGLLRCRKDTLLSGAFPKPSSALNKTEYYKNIILEKNPYILDNIEILSEIKDWKSGIICRDQFGEVKISARSLIEGQIPSQRSAINYKEYLKNKLIYIHKDFGYDFEVINSDYSYLICPKHGKIKILNKYLLRGYICSICKSDVGSNIFYLVRLQNSNESFYKIGISRKTYQGVLRYKDYKSYGYNIFPIIEAEFDNSGDSKVLEQQVKDIIKNNLYNPKQWNYETSRESFIGEDILVKVLNIINMYIKGCNGLCVSSDVTSKTSGCGCCK